MAHWSALVRNWRYHPGNHFMLSERSEAHRHKDTSKWLRFFPVRDIPLHFVTLNRNLSAPIDLNRLNPGWALRWFNDLSYPIFSAADCFLLARYAQRLKLVFPQSAKPRLRILFLRKSWKWCFCTNGRKINWRSSEQWHFLSIFFGQFCRKRAKMYGFFKKKDLWHTSLPTAFVSFHDDF